MGENPMLHAHLYSCIFYRNRVIAVRSFTLTFLAFFRCCDLDLDPMTFIYELEMYPQTENELQCQGFESYHDYYYHATLRVVTTIKGIHISLHTITLRVIIWFYVELDCTAELVN